jgi:putative peptidoglycan lipid II flippase
VALIVAAVPIMEVLFVRGAFDSASAVGSAHALAAYAVGLPAFVLVKVLVPGFFARGDTATPVRVGLLSIGLNLALNLSLIWWLAHVGLALASSLAAMFNAGALAVLLQRRGHLAVDAQLRRRVPRMALAAAAMALTLVAIERTVYAWLAPDHVLRWVGLFVLVGFGIGAYFIAAEILGACRIREMIQSFRRPAAS